MPRQPNGPWVKHMCKLNHLRKETKRINRVGEEDTEKIDAEGGGDST